MAIKTKSELQGQSDNTFLDNTEGLIIPANHRTWNDDLLDTAFVLAGREVQLSEFNQLISDGELTIGTTYSITDFTIYAFNADYTLNVIATASNLIYPVGIAYNNAQFFKVYVADDLSANQLITQEGSPMFNNWTDANIAIQNDHTFNGATIPFVPTNATTFPVVQAKVALDDPNIYLRHNTYAQRGDGLTTQKNLWVGTINTESDINSGYFYPDNGTQQYWGSANQSGDLGYLQIYAGDGISGTDVPVANFVKTNVSVFGMIQCNVDAEYGNSSPIPYFDFDLPYPLITSGFVQYFVIGHGQAIDEAYSHVIFCDVQCVGQQMGRCYLRLIGNHTGTLTLKVNFSFSYNIEYV